MPPFSLFPNYTPKFGHYDEVFDAEGNPRPHWQRVARAVHRASRGELSRRADTIRRAVEQDGVTYNVYADPKGTDRPWEVDLLPMVIGADEWRFLSHAIKQRARLLNAILADLYGPGRLIAEGLLPPAVIYGHHSYLWPCRGVEPLGGTFLHLYGCDLARSSDGRWWVVADRTQGPSGAGYTLQNRLIVGPLYGGLFATLGVQRLAAFFRTLQQHLAGLAPTDGEKPLIALLTPGPYNETYFEHVFLARYLGFALVEGSDLTVRHQRLYLKTLEGLKRVHVLLRRLDDEYCDPAVLRSDSTLGVPGLLGVARAGNVVIANALGSGVLESPAILGFLPAICQELLGEPLELPSVATWWCGETPALEHAIEHLPDLVIKPAFPSMNLEPTFGHALDDAGRATMAERMRATPHAFVAQEWVHLSQAPTWSSERQRFEPRNVGMRLYAVANPAGYEVMPGGLARVAPAAGTEVISMQSGGASKDIWMLDGAATVWETLLQPRIGVRDIVRGGPYSPSRAVENSFWMGRYAERVEVVGRLLRATVHRLVESDSAHAAALEVLTVLCEKMGLREAPQAGAAEAKKSVLDSVAGDEWLIAAIGGVGMENGLPANTARLLHCAAQLRERISLDNWHTVQRLARAHEPPPDDLESALAVLDRVLPACTALAGYALDDMTRDDAWRFLITGRQIERTALIASTVSHVLSQPDAERDAALGSLLEIGNSIITYRARYQRQPELLPVLDLLILDNSNPHSVGFQIAALAGHIEQFRRRLGFQPVSDPRPLVQALQNFDLGRFEDPRLPFHDEPERFGSALHSLLADCEYFAYALSDELSRRYFVHAGEHTQASLAA